MSNGYSRLADAIMNSSRQMPQCECGQLSGLAEFDGVWWCPLCLWRRVQKLEAIVENVRQEVLLFSEDMECYDCGFESSKFLKMLNGEVC